MKPNNTNMGNFFGFTRQTISTWKKERFRVYQALKEYFIKVHKDL